MYFFVEYVRPQDRIGVVHALKIGLFTTLATAVMWFRYGDRSVFRDPLIRTHLAFIVAAALTVAFAVNTFWVYQTTQSLVLMFLGGTLPATAFLAYCPYGNGIVPRGDCTMSNGITGGATLAPGPGTYTLRVLQQQSDGTMLVLDSKTVDVILRQY